MARKYGKNETTLSNVLKLVKALLVLADGEIDVPGDKLKATLNEDNGEIYVSGDELKATLKLLWKGKGIEKDELWVSGKVQQKRNNGSKPDEKGITKEDLWTLVECLGEALELSQPKDEKNVDNAQRRSDAIQDVLDCLKDLGILVLEDSARNQGFWKFFLKLKHQTARKEENLKVIKEQWKIKIRSVTVETSRETTFISKDQPLNWQEICRQNLAQQKQLTTNPFTNANGVTPQLDEIYVPLAIVERKPPKPPSRNQLEEKEEEKLIPITEECFFEEVLRQEKSEISQGRKIAIIGEQGSGKTTRLQKIADSILEQTLGLPIWVSLADLTQPTITQYIEDIWLKQTGQSLTIDELTQQKERIWLLLDGLDEMTSRVEMRHVSALLGGWVQAARVVVTCRVNVWEADKNAFSGFDVFRNLEFNAEQVTDYIRRWFAGMRDAATGESLEAALAESENSRLKELIQNPLRLWMLCQIWQTGGGLPETQAGLYGQFVNRVYDWKADDEILDQREAIDTALAQLALAAMEQKDEVSRLRLRESWVLKVLGSRPIFQAVMKLGWLNRVERFPEAICVFYHATFQEYFAALAVDDWDYFLPRNHVNFSVAGKEYRIFEAQWKQVILLWLGRDIADEEKEGFIEKLVNFDDGCGEWNFQKVDRGFYEYRSYFLAAAGINEFKSCSLASEIVKQVVKWRFGYFHIERQAWRTFRDPIEKGARKAISETIRQVAITELIKIIENCPDEDEYFLWRAAESLGKIDPGNPQVIAAWVNLVEKNESEYIRWRAAESLAKIDPRNPQAIAALVNLIETTEDKYGWRAAESLGKIDPGNPQAIAALVNLIETTEDKFTRMCAAISLVEIEQGNSQVIPALVNLIENTKDEDIRMCAAISLVKIEQGNSQVIPALVNLIENTKDEDILLGAAESLGEIDPGNPQVIAALVKLIETNNSEYIWRKLAKNLSKIDPGNPQVIAALVKLIENSKNEYTRRKVASSLEKIGQGNPQIIAALVKLIETTENGYSLWTAVDSLGKIDPGNSQAIAALVKVIETTKDESTRREAAESLGKIDPGNPQAIATLVKVIETTEDEATWIEAVVSLGKIDLGNPQTIATLVKVIETTEEKEDKATWINSVVNLGKIGQGNPQAIATLVKVIETTKSGNIRSWTAKSLQKILTTPEQYAGVVSALKHNLNNEINNFYRFEECYEVLWHCAANLPYPQFYQAWHGLTETQTSPLVQTLNLAQLPQLLQTQLTETNLHQTLQLLCIDGSKFDNPDNPATDIYLQLVKKHHCPKSTEGTPRTLTELKIYWQLLDWDKHPILIFYEDAIPQGFSPTFLDFLTRFDATICAIAESPHPTIPTFSPQDTHVIQKIITWVQRTILEI